MTAPTLVFSMKSQSAKMSTAAMAQAKKRYFA
jgi:hypothetical protein